MQLPGLARALVSAGQLSEATAREVALKATASKSSFVAQLVNSGHFSAAELAHQISLIFSTPLLDLNAIDPLLLPKDLLDPKLCTSHHVLPLCKRGNRLIVATAAPTDKEATEKIKFASQMGIDWIIAEHDKLSDSLRAHTKASRKRWTLILQTTNSSSTIPRKLPSRRTRTAALRT